MKTITGYSAYTVDELGVVRRGERVITATPAHGYYRVKLIGDDKKRRWHHVAVLVLEAFVGPRPTIRHEAAHVDGRRENNRLANLAWKTREENEADKKLHGSAARQGGRRERLSRHKVRRIRVAAARFSIGKLAKTFGVHRRTVARIVRGAA